MYIVLVHELHILPMNRWMDNSTVGSGRNNQINLLYREAMQDKFID